MSWAVQTQQPQVVHLLCGVPGSGKTWIARQLPQFTYIPHDDYPVANYAQALVNASQTSTKPILAEAPFRISILIDQIRMRNIKVITYYIQEPEQTIRQRYEQRDLKPFPKQHQSNLNRYNQRPWDHRGTSQLILNLLKSI